jgi:hypothetical protein
MANEVAVKASIERVLDDYSKESYVNAFEKLPNGNMFIRFPVWGHERIFSHAENSLIVGVPDSEVSLQVLEVLGGETLQAAKTKLCSDVRLQEELLCSASAGADVLGLASSLYKPHTVIYANSNYNSLHAVPKTLRKSQYKREPDCKIRSRDILRIEFGSIYKELCDGK